LQILLLLKESGFRGALDQALAKRSSSAPKAFAAALKAVGTLLRM
jgi:hypothetical protein